MATATKHRAVGRGQRAEGQKGLYFEHDSIGIVPAAEDFLAGQNIAERDVGAYLAVLGDRTRIELRQWKSEVVALLNKFLAAGWKPAKPGKKWQLERSFSRRSGSTDYYVFVGIAIDDLGFAAYAADGHPLFFSDSGYKHFYCDRVPHPTTVKKLITSEFYEQAKKLAKPPKAGKRPEGSLSGCVQFRYIYRGQTIEVAEVLGNRWCTCTRKPNGSLVRIKSPLLRPQRTAAAAQRDLDEFARKRNLPIVAGSLADPPPPAAPASLRETRSSETALVPICQSPVLNAKERANLASLERVITAKLGAFVEVGRALCAIRQRRLYRETHKSFEEYCRERWDFQRAYAHRLIAAAEVVQTIKVSPKGDTVELLPATETQARPLSRLKPQQQAEVWAEAVAEAPRKNGRPAVTAAVVEAKVRQALGESARAATAGNGDGRSSRAQVLPAPFSGEPYDLADCPDADGWRSSTDHLAKVVRAKLDAFLNWPEAPNAMAATLRKWADELEAL